MFDKSRLIIYICPMQDVREVIKSAGLRVTNQRIAILEYLIGSDGPVVLHALHKKFSDTVNRITLYRILNDFEEKKIVKLFFGQGGQKHIEFIRAEKNGSHLHGEHLHFQCKRCDKLFCLDDVELKNLPEGFNLSSAQSVLVGKCDKCD